MSVQGISSRESQFQAFQALNAKKQESTQKQEKAAEESLINKLSKKPDKEEDASQMFKLSVEKEQGKGNNISLIG